MIFFLIQLGANAILTDQKSMVPLMNDNVLINDIPKDKIRVDDLFWGTSDNDKFKDIDYILASDCIYLGEIR